MVIFQQTPTKITHQRKRVRKRGHELRLRVSLSSSWGDLGVAGLYSYLEETRECECLLREDSMVLSVALLTTDGS
jgi:hypothetical protein